MVREVRYAWDDEENNVGLPDRQDRFDDADDDLLDPFFPEAPFDGSQSAEDDPEKNVNRRKHRPDRKSERRHLADADWVNDDPSVKT